jgi:hypothetical protein
MTPFRQQKRFRQIATLALLAASGCATSSAASAQTNRTLSSATRQQTSGPELQVPEFEFDSGFWVNLHHFLYLQARLDKGNPASTDNGRGEIPPDEKPVSLLDFPLEQIRAWQDAIAFYEKDLAGRDLQLNGDMEIINNRLSEMSACPDLEGKTSPACRSGLRPELVEALEAAAPVYRSHWWTEHDRANREWIAQVTPIVQQMGVELSGQLAEIYQRPWPPNHLRVDVVWYGGPYGAYTSLSPIHVTISSHDARNQGIYGFEVLFHESSHALSGEVTEAIAKQFRERDKPIPRDLWHALLFYTTGEIIRRDLAYGGMNFTAQQGVDLASYQPYATRFGLYSGGWERFRGLLDLYWRPYLDGKVSFDTAIARLASAM